jgi:YD repeat-containing protein
VPGNDWDALDRLFAVSAPGNPSTRTVYDSLGRAVTNIFPDNAILNSQPVNRILLPSTGAAELLQVGRRTHSGGVPVTPRCLGLPR